MYMRNICIWRKESHVKSHGHRKGIGRQAGEVGKETHLHEHACYNEQVPQGNEDSEISQALEKFPNLISSCGMAVTIFKRVRLRLLAVPTTQQWQVASG